MTRVILLPRFSVQPDWSEMIGVVLPPNSNLPDLWKPLIENTQELEQIEAFAFPTPFAWAEIMISTLKASLYEHLLFKQYKNLVLGFTLGYLELEIVDLKEYEFGKVLYETNKHFRYFGLLRGSSKSRELDGKIFGATSPYSLFWPSPRCSSDEWTNLNNIVHTDTNYPKAQILLADFRNLLQQAHEWDNKVPWMAALDHIIKASPSSNHTFFHIHNRICGPVVMNFPKDVFKPLYFPTYSENFAPSLLQALTGTFRLENNAVTVYDDRNLKLYSISMPMVPSDGNTVLAGSGNIRPIAVSSGQTQGQTTNSSSHRIRLHDDEKGQGLFSILQPLYQNIDSDINKIRNTPFFYPSIIHVIINRLGQVGIPNSHISYSDQAFQIVFQSNQLGLPIEQDLSGPKGFVFDYSAHGQSRKNLYIEEHNNLEVGDLRALGWVLWVFFIGKASKTNGNIYEGTNQLLELQNGYPCATVDSYNKTKKPSQGSENPERVNCQNKLATLQRFMKAYTNLYKKSNASQLDRLCFESAEAFARWAIKGLIKNNIVLPNGYLCQKEEELSCGGNIIRLLQDNINKDE